MRGPFPDFSVLSAYGTQMTEEMGEKISTWCFLHQRIHQEEDENHSLCQRKIGRNKMDQEKLISCFTAHYHVVKNWDSVPHK